MDYEEEFSGGFRLYPGRVIDTGTIENGERVYIRNMAIAERGKRRGQMRAIPRTRRGRWLLRLLGWKLHVDA